MEHHGEDQAGEEVDPAPVGGQVDESVRAHGEQRVTQQVAAAPKQIVHMTMVLLGQPLVRNGTKIVICFGFSSDDPR
ncbi:hypothetical protein Misp01_52070 [Microtetraspora sp. NBRC 13810]|nr:hypothetical protein Misp01_52070 [Microtetraspora sp. NBRC 13810]